MVDLETLDALAETVSARAGCLDYLRTRTQLEAHEKFQRMPGMSVFHLDCSRRFGKTYDAAMKAFEVAQARPGAVIRYSTQTKLAGRQYALPAFEWVAKRVPSEMRPQFHRQDTCWRWANGSVCYLGSAETMGDVEAQVGTDCDLAIGDEAGKWPYGLLSHWISSVIMPQFAYRKWGKVFIPSTPPLTPAHDLSVVRARAVVNGYHAKYTIDDLDQMDPDAKAALVKAVMEGIDGESGGETAVMRELYCEYVTDDSIAIIPEMRHVRADIIEPCTRPEFYDCYVAGDFGFSDLTVILFAYLDWSRAVLCIEDELVFRGKSAIEVGRQTMDKRRALWGVKVPRAQMADAPLQVIADMAEGTKSHPSGMCVFGSIEKTDSDAALNTARRMLIERKVRIDPRCKVLIDHLTNGVWNRSRTSFDRSDSHGHFDAIDAFKYLVRHVDWTRCPVPYMHGVSPHTHHIQPATVTKVELARQPLVRRRLQR